MENNVLIAKYEQLKKTIKTCSGISARKKNHIIAQLQEFVLCILYHYEVVENGKDR